MARILTPRLLVMRASLLLFVSGLAGYLALPDSFRQHFQPTAHAQTTSVFVVNSTGDGADSSTADGVCSDATGNCTLRAAIQQANATAGADIINFQIGTGAQTIAVGSALPVITEALTIDATTQPGFAAGAPVIELSGGGNVTGNGLTIIGGSSTVRGLVINRFVGHGIALEFANGNVVAGNFIGTDASGNSRAANTRAGVYVADSNNNVIGGTDSAARNVISGNQYGVQFAAGAAVNLVRGNFIGTNAAGTAAIGNTQAGVILSENSNANVIGGDTVAARNVISGNTFAGIEMASGASDNLIQGNFIGTTPDGTAQLGNFNNGIRDSAGDNLVGGLTATPGAPPGNVIVGSSTGIFVLGRDTTIRGNLIGTNAAGTAKLGSGDYGIDFWAGNTTIGGAMPGARNVISGRTYGIASANSGSATIQGNFIGTDITGTSAIGNTIGVRLGTGGNLLGGTSADARNVISGNTVGVQVSAAGSTMQGNFIGLDASGAAMPNSSDGILIADVAIGGAIGGEQPGAGNVIAFNGNNGIGFAPRASGDFYARYTIRRNSIHSNGALGIDLVPIPTSNINATFFSYDGPTPNDAGDADKGPNGLQNYPVLLSVTQGGGNTNIQGTLNSTPNTTFAIDFYANAACDASGHGEGQTFLGTTSILTDASGNAAFNVAFATPPSAGQVTTATATDSSGNTSEFSVCNEGSAPGTAQFASAAYSVEEDDGTATITVTRTLGSAGAATVDYALGNGSATAGEDYLAASGTLSFAPGETTKTVNVTVVNDGSDEDVETLNLTLSNPTGGITLGSRSTTVLSISDDDFEPRLSIADVSVVEGNSGTTDAVFNVKLTPASGRTVTVEFVMFDSTALNFEDYQALSGTLTFAPGETNKTIVVTVNGDTQNESDESFIVQLRNPTNAFFESATSSNQAEGIIFDDDTPGIHFAAPTFTANEAAHFVNITVVRRGDAAAAASVEYQAASSDGTFFDNDNPASSRSDYTLALGTLRFAPGETEKSFTILLTDDVFVEAPETVTLKLSNPTDAPAGTEFTARLIIQSDDTAAPAGNPADNATFFVRQHYHDFLNREPDASGLDFWVNQIEECGADTTCREIRRINVSAAFFLSIEFQQTGYLVYRFHQAAFDIRAMLPLHIFLRDTQQIGRDVVVEAEGWEAKLEANKQAFAAEFVTRPAFLAAYPQGMSAAAFIDKLNGNTGGSLTQAERNELVGKLGSGEINRAQAMRAVAENRVFQLQEFNRAFVLMQYFGYLRREPNAPPNSDFSGFNFWLAKLNQFNGNFVEAEMVKAFITSGEYRGRFGPQ